MSKYVLDTNILSCLYRGNISVVSKFQPKKRESIFTTVISKLEITYGIRKANIPTGKANKILSIFEKTTLLNLDEKSICLFGDIKSDLGSNGNIIEDFDILIASIAIANKSILVTNNEKHFERIPGLKIENWAK